MAEYERNSWAQGGASVEGAAVDAGLRSYMLSVYNYMAIGVAITGVFAYLTFSMAVQQTGAGTVLTPFGAAIYTSPLKWVVMLAPLAFIFLFSATSHKMSPGVAQLVFWGFAAIMGISISSIFLNFGQTSIARVFFITATAFAGLSLWGYTTKKNLSAWGSFLIMGVIGLIVASLVNIFLQSSALQWAVSAIGLLVFAGLTAYDTQRIREVYYYVRDDATAVKSAAINGALSLYLDFINMFMFMLQMFGGDE